MRAQVRGECSVERKRKKDCGRFWRTVGTEENVGQGYPDCTRIRKHSTSRRVTHAPPPGTREKRMESAESENGRLRRNECMGGEVREKTGCVVLTCRRTTCVVMVVHFDNLLYQLSVWERSESTSPTPLPGMTCCNYAGLADRKRRNRRGGTVRACNRGVAC